MLIKQGSIFDKGEGSGSEEEQLAITQIAKKKDTKASRAKSLKNPSNKKNNISAAPKHLKIGKAKTATNKSPVPGLADLPISPKEGHTHCDFKPRVFPY